MGGASGGLFSGVGGAGAGPGGWGRGQGARMALRAELADRLERLSGRLVRKPPFQIGRAHV